MELDEKELESGMTWLVGAGGAAIMLSIFLQWADNALTNSQREQELGNTIRQVRTAQTTLPGRAIDQRLSIHDVVKHPANGGEGH